jgi:hypothetical protein
LERVDLCIEPGFYKICQDLNKIEILKEFLIGEWSTDPPQSLKSYMSTIEHMVTSYFLKSKEPKEEVNTEDDDDGFTDIGETNEDRTGVNSLVLEEIIG